jgi:hypothetical protein
VEGPTRPLDFLANLPDAAALVKDLADQPSGRTR